MIIVNIKVPALEKEYNFSVDENAPVSELIEEVVELIAQKEGVQFSSLLKLAGLYRETDEAVAGINTTLRTDSILVK